MPAHTRPCHVGVIQLGNGELLSVKDRLGNTYSDAHAKVAVREHRVPEEVINRVKDYDQLVWDTAIWLGVVTQVANSHDWLIPRDSHAMRTKSMAPRIRRGAKLKSANVQPRLVALVGHHLLPLANGGVWCPTCRRKAGPRRAARFGQAPCPQPVVQKWNKRARGEVEPAPVHHSLPGLNWIASAPVPPQPEEPPHSHPPPPFLPPAHQPDDDAQMPAPAPPATGHTILVSGNVYWCGVCGQWTHDPETWPRRVCPGAPGLGRGPRHQRARLDRLRACRHPDRKNPTMLPPASPWQPSGARAPPSSVAGEHIMLNTGFMHWCKRCGCFATSSRARGLQEAYQGTPSQLRRHRDAGRLNQLRRLNQGLHPMTGLLLGCAEFVGQVPDAPQPKRQRRKGPPPQCLQQHALLLDDDDKRVFETFCPRLRVAHPADAAPAASRPFVRKRDVPVVGLPVPVGPPRPRPLPPSAPSPASPACPNPCSPLPVGLPPPSRSTSRRPPCCWTTCWACSSRSSASAASASACSESGAPSAWRT